VFDVVHVVHGAPAPPGKRIVLPMYPHLFKL
jgi:hypothetical protein